MACLYKWSIFTSEAIFANLPIQTITLYMWRVQGRYFGSLFAGLHISALVKQIYASSWRVGQLMDLKSYNLNLTSTSLQFRGNLNYIGQLE